MTVPLHDRTLFHQGQEDTTTATIAAPIGRYPRGMDVQSVLEDMALRLALIEGAGPSLVVTSFTLSAWIGGPRTLTLDAVIRPNLSLTLDAQIRGTVSRSLTLDSYFVDHVGGATTLVGSINSGVTSIVVSSTATFPFSGTFVIQIDSEQMLVTAGQGSTTWTVTRGYNGTSAASHSSGVAVNEVC